MADISMCLGRKCPEKERCRRYLSKPDPTHQRYAEFDEDRTRNGYCRAFRPVEEEVE